MKVPAPHNAKHSRTIAIFAAKVMNRRQFNCTAFTRKLFPNAADK
jgi:hypothetical protein